MPIRATIAATLEITMIVFGVVLLWRLVFSPAARSVREPSRLAEWDAPVSEFLLFLLLILFGTILAGGAAVSLGKRLSLVGDSATVFNGAAAQLGMLAGIAAFHLGVDRKRANVPPDSPGIFVSGAITFLMTLPLLIATSQAWEIFLRVCGVPAERQSLLRLFSNTDSPARLATLVTIAIVVAPLTEEMIFRAGLFRYLRTRVPRWAALTIPSLVFASLHVENWTSLAGFASFAPLVVLAVMFSLAYERTGRIGTPMVAHALFNLNTIVLVFSGLGDVT